jgi:hypothetical protein
VRRLVPGLFLLLFCVACRDDSAATPSTAEVRWTDAGAELRLDARAVPVPDGDLEGGTKPSVVQDKEGKRLAYPTKTGEVRLVYRLGDALYAGPRAKAPVDFRSAPDLDHALGAIFENADKRGALVAEVGRALGNEAIVRLLIDGAHVPAPEWEAAYDKLPDPKKAEVRTLLATYLQPGKPTGGLRRAVRYVSLREPARVSVLEARLEEIVPREVEPRAEAVMLRVLAQDEHPDVRKRASAIACDVLKRTPLHAGSAPAAQDPPGREVLVEAAVLTIANDVQHGGALACEGAVTSALVDPCIPQLRCANGSPMTGREDSRWDEPTCTKTELASAVTQEIARPAPEILDLTAATRRELFAVAALAAADKIPASFVAAHERRRFAIVQPKEPECAFGQAPGTPCHCDENTLRSYGCRASSPHKPPGESTSVHVGLCRFDIDEKNKKLTNVVSTPPP